MTPWLRRLPQRLLSYKSGLWDDCVGLTGSSMGKRYRRRDEIDNVDCKAEFGSKPAISGTEVPALKQTFATGKWIPTVSGPPDRRAQGLTFDVTH